MRKKLLIIFFALALLSLVWLLYDAYQKKNPVYDKVILIGWDGAERDHVYEMLEKGELKNLDRLGREGNIANIMIQGVTDTKSGWAEILTGYSANKTGVFYNEKYRPIPVNYTIFEHLENMFQKKGITTAFIAGKKDNVDDDGELMVPVNNETLDKYADEITEGIVINVSINNTKYMILPAKPYNHTVENIDLFLNGLAENEKVGNVAIDLIRSNSNKSFFFFFHFGGIDHIGHMYGENSKEYSDEIAEADKWLGEIIRSLKEMNIYNKTLIYVTADHGFDKGEKRHSNAPYVFLVTNDKKIVRAGTAYDIAPTIYERMGVKWKKKFPKLDGTPLSKR